MRSVSSVDRFSWFMDQEKRAADYRSSEERLRARFFKACDIILAAFAVAWFIKLVVAWNHR